MASNSTSGSLHQPDLVNENLSWVALVIVVLLLSLATTSVALRVYTRVFLVKQLGWDDYMAVVTLLVILADGGLVLGTIPYGLGRHTKYLDRGLIEPYLRTFWLSIVVYNAALTMIKLTFLFQYYRVLAVHKMKRTIQIVGIVIMAWSVSQLLLILFVCTPIQKFWQPELKGTCTPNLPFWYINAAGNIATDVAIFVLPLPVLSKLHLRRKQKYFLVGIFSLGFFTSAISLIRLAYLRQGPDFTFDNVPTACWSVGELCCGIICASLPTLRPLMSKIKPQWMVSYATRHGHTSHHTRKGSSSQYAGTALANKLGSHSVSNESSSISSSKSYARIKETTSAGAHMPPPPPSPTGSEFAFATVQRAADDDSSSSSRNVAVPMRSLQRRASDRSSDKAMEVLGMGASGGGSGSSSNGVVGVSSTHVAAERGASQQYARGGHVRSAASVGSRASGQQQQQQGIEVKTDVIVTSMPTPGMARSTSPRHFS